MGTRVNLTGLTSGKKSWEPLLYSILVVQLYSCKSEQLIFVGMFK